MLSNPVKKQVPITVGILGAGNGCGVTHFSILLANYLAAVEQERTALLAWNPRDDLEKLVHIYTCGRKVQEPVSLLDVDYYYKGGPEALNICIQGGYTAVILDLGRLREGRQTEFLQCQRQCFLLALNEWRLGDVIVQKEFLQKGKEHWDFFMVFGSEEARKEIWRRYGIKASKLPFAPDAFSIDWEMAGVLDGFWKRKR